MCVHWLMSRVLPAEQMTHSLTGQTRSAAIVPLAISLHISIQHSVLRRKKKPDRISPTIICLNYVYHFIHYPWHKVVPTVLIHWSRRANKFLLSLPWIKCPISFLSGKDPTITLQKCTILPEYPLSLTTVSHLVYCAFNILHKIGPVWKAFYQTFQARLHLIHLNTGNEQKEPGTWTTEFLMQWYLPFWPVCATPASRWKFTVLNWIWRQLFSKHNWDTNLIKNASYSSIVRGRNTDLHLLNIIENCALLSSFILYVLFKKFF